MFAETNEDYTAGADYLDHAWADAEKRLQEETAMAMQEMKLSVDDALLRKARQYADERETTLEALIVEHLTMLADRAGRGLTTREQVYVDCSPSEEVRQALRDKGYPGGQKAP